MPLLILQFLFLGSGGGIWEEIMDVFTWRKFHFQTALPTRALHKRSLRAPFWFSCAGGGNVQQPALHDGVEEVDQTNKNAPHVFG